jgi:hypothetical protein
MARSRAAGGGLEVVVDATDWDVSSATQVAVGVAIRLPVFTAAVYLVAQLRLGKHWARVALAVGLGGIGILSLVIGPLTWLAEGGSLAANAYVQAATGLGPGHGSTATAGPSADRLLGVPSGYRQVRTPSPDAAGRSSAPPAGSATTRMEELDCPG